MRNELLPYYPHNGIFKLSSLERILGVEISELDQIILNVSNYYFQNKPKNGRITYSVLEPLKSILIKINETFLKRVIYPKYLHGFIKERSCITNAKVHSNKKTIINEDILKFFDNCNTNHVKNIWKYFFNFSDEIANLLVQITTWNNKLPQGAPTSPLLSNLIFWSDEHRLVEKLSTMDMVYTRYGDDITVSTNKKLTKEDKTKVISLIYGFMLKFDFKPKRQKHKIYNSANKMRVNGQVVNSNVNLPTEYYLKLRAAIYKLKNDDSYSKDRFDKERRKISGRIGRLSHYNKVKGNNLRAMLN